MRLQPWRGEVMRLIVQLETNAVKVALRPAGRDDVLNCAVVRTVADTRHSAIQFARNDAPKRKIAEHSRICRNRRRVLQKTVEIVTVAILNHQIVSRAVHANRPVSAIETDRKSVGEGKSV